MGAYSAPQNPIVVTMVGKGAEGREGKGEGQGKIGEYEGKLYEEGCMKGGKGQVSLPLESKL